MKFWPSICCILGETAADSQDGMKISQAKLGLAEVYKTGR